MRNPSGGPNRIGERPRFWAIAAQAAILIVSGVIVALVAFTALVVVIPLALVGGLALHFYIRRKLRQAAQRRPPSEDLVIEGEYVVVDRPSEVGPGARSPSPR
jgi:hypothetical protein